VTRRYRYVGPRRLADLASSNIERFEPTNQAELAAWLRTQGHDHEVTLTYVVTTLGCLRLSDRHAEHVACAQGQPVFGAGELSLLLDGAEVEVAAVTNQSTGYCPEPACFTAVAQALVAAQLEAPEGFAHAFVFRRCPECEGIVIVKDDEFECPTCALPLPVQWNFAD
jgi:hypothetical protein